MPHQPSELLIRTLEARDEVRPEERAVLENCKWQIKEAPQGSRIVASGSRPSQCCLILEGVAGRSHMLKDGGQQFSNLHFAGDFVDLHSLTIKVMDHNVTALTACRIAFVEHGTLERVTRDNPHLTRLLWMLTNIDSAVERAWIVCLGRRSSEAHLAHLFCEMFLRLKVVGLTNGNSFPLPISQATLADTLGLSTVHTNRTLQLLRGEGLIEWRQGSLTILDPDALAKLAEFNPTYLSLRNEPR